MLCIYCYKKSKNTYAYLYCLFEMKQALFNRFSLYSQFYNNIVEHFVSMIRSCPVSNTFDRSIAVNLDRECIARSTSYQTELRVHHQMYYNTNLSSSLTCICHRGYARKMFLLCEQFHKHDCAQKHIRTKTGNASSKLKPTDHARLSSRG